MEVSSGDIAIAEAHMNGLLALMDIRDSELSVKSGENEEGSKVNLDTSELLERYVLM